MEKDRALHLKKPEFPSPKDELCQVWLQLAQWFWRRRFLKFVNVFLQFHNYLPFKDRPFNWTNLNPFHSKMLCAKFGWNWPSGSGEEDQNVESFRWRWQRWWGTTDKFWSEKLTGVFGSGELKVTRTKRIWTKCSILSHSCCLYVWYESKFKTGIISSTQ